MLLPVSDIYFLEVNAHVYLKVATKKYFRGKNLREFRFYRFFLKQKRKSVTKKLEVFFDKSGMLMPYSDKYILKLSALVSLKVATKEGIRYYSMIVRLNTTIVGLLVSSYRETIYFHSLCFPCFCCLNVHERGDP